MRSSITLRAFADDVPGVLQDVGAWRLRGSLPLVWGQRRQAFPGTHVHTRRPNNSAVAYRALTTYKYNARTHLHACSSDVSPTSPLTQL